MPAALPTLASGETSLRALRRVDAVQTDSAAAYLDGVAAGHGNDTITDFTDGEDAIDLTAIAGIAGFEDLTITQEGNNAVIDLTAQDGVSITLKNFDVADLDAADFVFQETPVDGI